jgi:DNA-binding beta-propeller fold protein YncE
MHAMNINPFRENETMRMKTILRTMAGLGALALTACLTSETRCKCGVVALGQRLYVAHAGALAAWDLDTYEQVPGEITNVNGPTDMQALRDGTLLVNLSDNNEILAFDGRSMIEKARIPASTLGAKRPVHSYISPERNGKRYWMALNDGDGSKASNSARFVDVEPGSARYLAGVGEVALGIGHHKAAFSSTKERVAISNLGDCDDVISVYDYSDIGDIKKLATLSAADAGWNDSTKKCDPAYKQGVPPAPHGCATSRLSGKAYCNLTGDGRIAVVDIDAAVPSFSFIATHGSGGGYTKAHPGGRYVYTLQNGPREAGRYAPGAACQVGQLAVIDASDDSLVAEMPLLYGGPACKDSISKGDEATTEPAHLLISEDGKTLFVQAAGGFGVAEARVRRQLVVDISDPANPVQKASIGLGTSTGYHGETLSGDGKYLFEADNLDGTVTQIDAASGAVVKTLNVKPKPATVATWGEIEGPGHQTGPVE